MAKKKSAAKDVVVTPQERVKRYLVQRFYTRFHMSLILMGAGFSAMISNWALLHWGVTTMWKRYPLSMAMAYLAFLAGVWLWLQYVDFRRASNVADGDAPPDATNPGNARQAKKKSVENLGDLLDLPSGSGSSGGGSSVELPNIVRGGGGAFDGGGAGGAWGEPVPVQGLVGNSGGGSSISSSDSGKGFFDGFGDFGDMDGEAIVIVVLAIVLIGAIMMVSGYIIWFAPDILSEAVFGATLAGSLSGAARRQDSEGWVMGVVKKTWWPFASVFAAAMAFAIYAHIHYPAAKTLGEALHAAIAG